MIQKLHARDDIRNAVYHLTSHKLSNAANHDASPDDAEDLSIMTVKDILEAFNPVSKEEVYQEEAPGIQSNDPNRVAEAMMP